MNDDPPPVDDLAPKPRTIRARLRKAALWTGGVLLLYVGSYAVLSATGGWVVEMSGELRFPGSLALHDVFLWQPRYGRCRPILGVTGERRIDTDEIGFLYTPLILLDQRFVHPTIRFILPDGRFVDPVPAPPLSEYHPRIQNRWFGRFPYEAPPAAGD